MLVPWAMAKPLQTGKQAVNLAPGGVRVSRIRRDPPPKVKAKEVTIADRNERDAWVVVVGVITFALAIAVVVVGVGGWTGWSPRQVTIEWND